PAVFTVTGFSGTPTCTATESGAPAGYTGSGSPAGTCSASLGGGCTITNTFNVTGCTASDFAGFFPPVDNPPTVNTVNSGQGIPVKFSCGGNQGLNIFAAGYPKSQQISCTTSAPVSPIEQTVTAGSSSLQYDPVANQYIYVWKTLKAWAGTCRVLTIKFTDGTTEIAIFDFVS